MSPPDHFARNLCRKFGITLRKTMELSNARAEVTSADFWEWVRKIEAIIKANPDLQLRLSVVCVNDELSWQEYYKTLVQLTNQRPLTTEQLD